MKKISISISLIALLALFFTSCKQESASDYNNKIIKQQIEVVKKIDNLKKAIDDYNVLSQDQAIKEMNAAYDSAILQIDTSIAIVKSYGAFKKDSTLQSAAIELFSTYEDIVMKNYKQIIELYKLPDDMFTQDDSNKLKFLLNDANNKLDVAFSKFSDAQKAFGKKYKLNIN